MHERFTMIGTRVLTVSAGVLMVATVTFLSLKPDTPPRFSEERESSEVALDPLSLRANLPLDIRITERDGVVELSRHCHDRDAPVERCLYRYAPPHTRLSARDGAPTPTELSQLGVRDGFEAARMEANDGRTEVLYERLDRDAIESINGFVRVDGRWFDFECQHEVWDGGAHAYTFCMSALVALR